MIKHLILTLLALSLSLSLLAQVSFRGTIPYTSTPADAWDGISADCNVSISVKSTTGGLAFEDNLNSLNIKSMRIRQRDISSSQIPQNVILAISSDARATVSFDLYENNTFIASLGVNKSLFINWDQLQRLPSSEHYKQSTTDNGMKLYKSGAINIKNVRIERLSYAANTAYQQYYKQVAQDIAKSASSASSSQGSTTSTQGDQSTEVTVSSSTNASANESPAKVSSVPPTYSATPPKTKFERDMQTAAAIAVVATPLVEEWAASRARKAEQRQAESAAKLEAEAEVEAQRLRDKSDPGAAEFRKKGDYESLAKHYINLNDYHNAVEAYRAKFAITPPTNTDLYYFGSALMDIEDYKTADSTFAVITSNNPTYAYGHIWRARAQAYMDPETLQGLAKPHYEEFMRLASKDKAKYTRELVEANSYLGYYYVLKEDKQDAVKHFQEVLKLDPTNEIATEALTFLQR